MRRFGYLYYVFFAFFLVYLLFILVPIVRVLTFESFSYILQDSRTGIWQSISYTYLIALCVALLSVGFAIPYAFFTVRNNSRTVKLADNLVELPIMIPHTVVGVIMLITFEPTSYVGKLISTFIPAYRFDDTLFAVIVTLFFLSSAYTIRTVQLAYAKNIMKYEDVGRTLGLTPWKSYSVISLPMMKFSMLRGLVLSWARSISEVGSLLIVAYYILPSFTHLAGVFIYSQFLGSGLPLAVASSFILIITGFAALALLKLLESFK